MLTIANCKDCGYETIKATICEIDKKISQMGGMMYANDSYYLNDQFNVEKWESLVLYKAILQRKLYDCNYADIPTSQIISKAKEHIYG